MSRPRNPWPTLVGMAVLLPLVLACGGGAGTPTGSVEPFIGYLPDDGGGYVGGDTGDGGSGGSGGPLPLRLIELGNQTGIAGPTTWTARTQAEFDVMWSIHRPSTTTPPSVDFTTEMVVSAFVGRRTMQGCTVDIVAVTRNGSGAVVLWDEVVPQNGCRLPGPSVNFPFAIAAVRRVEGQVTYDGRTRAGSCPYPP